MKSIVAKTAFYTLVLLTSLTTQASSSGHEHRYTNSDKTNHSQERHESKRSYEKIDKNRPSVSIPEPGAIGLVGAGIIGLIIARRKRIRAQ